MSIRSPRRVFATVLRGAYPVWSALVTLVSARLFYGSMMSQTGGEWSAPLDDVFIHFDFAKSLTLGHPFEWTVGNGYSSGCTSWTYPPIMALGVLLGFRETELMSWAAFVAALCVFGSLLLLGRIWKKFFAAPLPRAIGLVVLPLFFLGIGALSWSLWSGMEVAVFLFVWCLTLRVAMSDLRKKGVLLGLLGAFLCATRPEAFVVLLPFAVWGAKDTKGGERITFLAKAILPAMGFFAVQAFANRVFTGHASAYGSLVKLAVYNPLLSTSEKLADYWFNLKYVFFRPVEYHFADKASFGIIVPLLAVLPLVFERTRRIAILIWAQVLLWLFVTALNGQVKYQNERYLMPAVAWVMVLAAMGLSTLVGNVDWVRKHALFVLPLLGIYAVIVGEGVKPSALAMLVGATVGAAVAFAFHWRLVRSLSGVVLVSLFFVHQAPKMWDQKWFFGRASRNIRDQQIRLGRWLRTLPGEVAGNRRVLVGDAGAILYTSGWRGLDAVGLGGFHDLPFARAGSYGLGATIELIERIPPAQRPSILAIFPSWWEDLPTFFGSQVLARFPAEGNVICGDYEHVVYQADWSLLGTGAHIRAMPLGKHAVADDLDVADLVNEDAHAFSYSPRAENGKALMKVLADPVTPERDMWDGGRRLAPGTLVTFDLKTNQSDKPATLVLRTAPEKETAIEVLVNGESFRETLLPHGSFVERPLEIQPRGSKTAVSVRVLGPGDLTLYHVYLAQ